MIRSLFFAMHYIQMWLDKMLLIHVYRSYTHSRFIYALEIGQHLSRDRRIGLHTTYVKRRHGKQ